MTAQSIAAVRGHRAIVVELEDFLSESSDYMVNLPSSMPQVGEFLSIS